MRTLDLGKYRKARVWLNELPPASFQSDDDQIVHASVRHSAKAMLIEAAVELFIPVGPRSLYGLLGAQHKADRDGDLIVKVGTCSWNGAIMPDSLASKGDSVRTGLPAEYAAGVMKGIEQVRPELASIGSGELIIRCAAHAEISSCEAVYIQLAIVLIRLIASANVHTSDGDLKELFPARFT